MTAAGEPDFSYAVVFWKDEDHSMIKIADHTDRLSVLRLVRQDDDAADAEFDHVCLKIFGVAWDDIDLDDDAFEQWMDWEPSAGQAMAFCKQHGYDISVDGRVPVVDFELFYAMVRAKAEGLLPAAGQSGGEKRLALEARQFVRDKDDGVIKGH